ncbi:MAG: glycoside hydrolase family 2 [Oscillospiraceae bacterium]|nr:glycoside hydrolase family 2 [Oscillospiraceae bacterium]
MLNDLYTPRGERLQTPPWQSYPRPQMKRESYVNLNGEWEFAVTQTADAPQNYPHKILVPFCPESLLSGLKMEIAPGSYLFYRRKLPPLGEQTGKRVLLHIGAADQVAEVFVNGIACGGHTGGYNAFFVDITEAVAEENELVIRVFDDLRDTRLPYGKQSLRRGGMWYTPVSGIWQTVWLEVVPEDYIRRVDIQTTLEAATVTVTPAMDGTVTCRGKQYPLAAGVAVITPEDPKLWTPENPVLYHFTVETDTDRLESYFALRTLSVEDYQGIPRLCLNGQPYFFHGLLDQGYWSDGIYTPADPECFAEDILAMKALGFNTLRKHIKVEPEQFYYDCDRLGMVVFQDMVNNGVYSFFRDTALPTLGIQKLSDQHMHRDEATRQAFLTAMTETVRQLGNHPCICYWTIFNEGWGQFCSRDAYRQLKMLDSTRFVDATSGWFRWQESDVDSRHIYFTPWAALRAGKKPLVLSEFGGYTYAVEDHLFNPEKVYGYKTCKSLENYQQAMSELYVMKVLPAVERGLCAAICTQISDVEDEINGMLTYDRRVCKADAEAMNQIADALRETFLTSCGLSTDTEP